MRDLEAILLDMGGVMLEMAGGRGFPRANLDWRGRQAMLRRVRDSGGRLRPGDLDRWVFEPWKADYERRVSRGREAAWEPHLERLRERSGCQASDERLLEAWFRPYAEHLRVIEGSREALCRLTDTGMRLALVSNVPLPGRFYLSVLDAWQLSSPLETLHFSYDERSRKPSPVMLKRALAHLGVAPERALMVGDLRNRDIAAGRAAGTRTAWIKTDDGGGPSADLELGSLADLPDLI